MRQIRTRPPRRVATARAGTARRALGRHPRRAPPRDSRLQVPHLARAARAGRGPRARPSTCARPSTSAPRSPSATCRCCAAPPPARFDAPRAGRGRRRRLAAPAEHDRRRPAGAPPTTARRGAAPEPQVQLRAVRDRRGQPLRPRRRAGRRRAARPGLQPALPARPARASARRTCCTPSATTSSATASGLRVRYATIEEFTTEFVDAVRAQPHRRLQGALPRRRRRADRRRPVPRRPRPRRARSSSTPSTALLDSGRQLVITSDRSPGGPPGPRGRGCRALPRRAWSSSSTRRRLEVRRAILAKRARLDGVEVPARRARPRSRPRDHSSVRALEGALIRVVAYASLQGRAAHARRSSATCCAGSARTPRPTPAASPRSSTPPPRSSASSATRCWRATGGPPSPRARQVAMYLARELTEHSLPEIGAAFGGRNHTTVLPRGEPDRRAPCTTDAAVRNAVDNLRRRLGQPASWPVSMDRITSLSTGRFPLPKPNAAPLIARTPQPPTTPSQVGRIFEAHRFP